MDMVHRVVFVLVNRSTIRMAMYACSVNQRHPVISQNVKEGKEILLPVVVMKSSTAIIVMVAIACYRVYHQFFPQESCDVDPTIRLNITLGEEGEQLYSWDACHVYSLEYHEARSKFRTAARKAGAQAASIPVVLDDGTDDSPLTTDIAILKGNLPGVLVHSSAIHGVEGYAGSAIQLALLQEGVLPPPEQRPTIVLVHAINPSGMKSYRRFNENNVDLNRNAIANFEEFLSQRDPNIAQYDDFRFLTAPERNPTWWDRTVGFWWTVLPAWQKYGYVTLKRVLVAGQYHHPQGIFYGGTQLESSLQQLLQFMMDEERSILAPLGKKEPVVWIDVHTGLGPFGMDTLQSEKDVSNEDMQKWFPTSYDRLTPDNRTTGAMDGYELSMGTLMSLVYKASQNTTLCLTQEFGTIPGVFVARAIILANMVHHYGNDHDRQTWGRTWLQAAFYPQSTRWRASVVRRGVAVALQSIQFIMNNA